MSVRKVARAAVALLGIIALVAALLPTGAAAQENPRFKRLEVSIWPEYDELRLLVRQKAELADGVSLPATLRFPVPAGAEIHTACAIDDSGKHLPKEWQLSTGDNPAITYTIDKRATDNEFYLQSFEGAGRREFTYKVRLPAAVDSLLVDVQQPLRSTNFSVTPAAKQTLNDKEGFQYHRFDYSNLTAGQEITFTVSYEKADAKPSVESRHDTSASSQAAATGNRGELGLVLVLFGAGVLAVGFFAFRGGSRRPAKRGFASRGQGKAPNRRPQTAAPATAPRAAPSRREISPPARQERQFCTRCGDRLRQGAAFCPGCGVQVGAR